VVLAAALYARQPTADTESRPLPIQAGPTARAEIVARPGPTPEPPPDPEPQLVPPRPLRPPPAAGKSVDRIVEAPRPHAALAPPAPAPKKPVDYLVAPIEAKASKLERDFDELTFENVVQELKDAARNLPDGPRSSVTNAVLAAERTPSNQTANRTKAIHEALRRLKQAREI
jgi:hypothetical protein